MKKKMASVKSKESPTNSYLLLNETFLYAIHASIFMYILYSIYFTTVGFEDR